MFSTILCPVDLEEESSWRKALPVALEMQRTFEARLELLTVLPALDRAVIVQYFPKDYPETSLKNARARLEAFARDNVPEAVSVRAHVAHGSVYDEILKTADEVGADLIVMASHRPELSDYLLGPNAARVVRHAKGSVFVVRE